MFSLLKIILTEIFPIQKDSTFKYTIELGSNDVLSLHSYVLNKRHNIPYKITHRDENGNSSVIDTGTYGKTLNYNFENEGQYIFTISNKSTGVRFVDIGISYSKKTKNVFFDQEVNQRLEEVFNGLVDNHKDSLRIFNLKKSIIDLANRWKFRVGFLLFLSPLYMLTAFLKMRYLKNLFSLKKQGI